MSLYIDRCPLIAGGARDSYARTDRYCDNVNGVWSWQCYLGFVQKGRDCIGIDGIYYKQYVQLSF